MDMTAGSAKKSSKGLDERRKSGTQMSEKLSTVSSEDIAMRSAGKYILKIAELRGILMLIYAHLI